MITALLFFIVLGILVFVHELGHFVVAKWAGIRVDEFGLGFPPRLFGKKIGETIYSLNLIPFGGYVKIFGENADDEPSPDAGPEQDRARNFSRKNRAVQAAVLSAGVCANVIFAWLIISAGFMAGMPTPVGTYGPGDIINPRLEVTGVTASSPADRAGLRPGDVIAGLSAGGAVTSATPSPDEVVNFIDSHGTVPITIDVSRGSAHEVFTVIPKQGILAGRPAIGISMDEIGTAQFSFFRAFWEGAKTTGDVLQSIVVGLYGFFVQLFTFQANLSEVSGPVGIANLVGDAAALGFINLVMLTAFISLNLAVINIIPFPALDGGRLLFVVVEAIRRKALPARVTLIANSVGFALLIALMVVVTYKDISRLL